MIYTCFIISFFFILLLYLFLFSSVLKRELDNTNEIEKKINILRKKYLLLLRHKRIQIELCENSVNLGTYRNDIYSVGNNCEPWISRECIYILDHILSFDSQGLEWSSGSSTIWLSFRIKSLISIENSYEWYRKVKKIVANMSMSERIKLYNIKPDEVNVCRNNSIYFSRLFKNKVCYKTYVTAENFSNAVYDYISVDGRARTGCILTAIQLIKKENGILLLDNSERKRYEWAINKIPKHWSRYDFNYSYGRVSLWITHRK